MPMTHWYKDGMAVEEWVTSKEAVTHQTEDGWCHLQIEDVVANDCGIYVCQAVNQLGFATTTTQVFIEGMI